MPCSRSASCARSSERGGRSDNAFADGGGRASSGLPRGLPSAAWGGGERHALYTCFSGSSLRRDARADASCGPSRGEAAARRAKARTVRIEACGAYALVSCGPPRRRAHFRAARSRAEAARACRRVAALRPRAAAGCHCCAMTETSCRNCAVEPFAAAPPFPILNFSFSIPGFSPAFS